MAEWCFPSVPSARICGASQLTLIKGVSPASGNGSPRWRECVMRVFRFPGTERQPCSASEGRILMKELGTERETQLAVGDSPAISPDGSFVAYTVTEGQKNSVYMVPTVGGAPRRICQDCASLGLKGFSADGSRVLAQDYSEGTMMDRIELINIASGEVKVVLSHPNRSLWHPYYSWDDKWMTFKMQLDPPRQ